MSFDTELQFVLSQVEGSQAVALMGFDGIIVAETRSDQAKVPYQEMGVELSRVLKEAAKVSVGNDVGDLSEMVLDSKKSQCILHVLNADYFVLMVLGPEANVGKGRYFLRRAIPALVKEL